MSPEIEFWPGTLVDKRLPDPRQQGAWTGVQQALCPDLLRYEQIGEADNLRGRVVRAFFWLMRAWPVKR